MGVKTHEQVPCPYSRGIESQSFCREILEQETHKGDEVRLLRREQGIAIAKTAKVSADDFMRLIEFIVYSMQIDQTLFYVSGFWADTKLSLGW